MFLFKRAAIAKANQVSVKRQRDPRVLMGLERMLLHWTGTMAFVVATSLRIGSESLAAPSVVKTVLQFVFLPFALSGVIYAVSRYYLRLRALQQPHQQVGESVVDLYGPYGLVFVLVAVLSSLLGVRLWDHWHPI
jgi:hypothetical protein